MTIEDLYKKPEKKTSSKQQLMGRKATISDSLRDLEKEKLDLMKIGNQQRLAAIKKQDERDDLKLLEFQIQPF